jgi:hypothetical protein
VTGDPRTLVGMSDPTADSARRLEVHYAEDDAALIVEVNEDPDNEDVEELIAALQAVDVDAAEDRLRSTRTGPRAIGRLGSYRRW